MRNSKISSMKLNPKSHKFLYFTFLLVSFLGFLDASYLTVKHFAGTPLPCSVLRGCEEVTTSQYSVVGGVPVALLGAIYYMAIFVLAFLYLRNKKVFFSKFVEEINNKADGILKFIAGLTTIGLLASFWFVYLQLFVIKAICLYCMFSAFTSILLFSFSVFFIRRPRN